jgi:hypothetical protein
MADMLAGSARLRKFVTEAAKTILRRSYGRTGENAAIIGGWRIVLF